MMFAKVGMTTLAIGAGLVAEVSLADAQLAPCEFMKPGISPIPALVGFYVQFFEVASLGTQTVGIGGTQPSSERELSVLVNVDYLEKAVREQPTRIPERQDALRNAIGRRDDKARLLGDAIDCAMTRINPNNQQDMKQLDGVFDKIQAINKTTNDAVLRVDEMLALFKEQAAAGTQN